MSRVGKVPIKIPEKVQVKVDGGAITVKGPGGEMERDFGPQVDIKVDGQEIQVSPVGQSKQDRSMWGTARQIINNMVVGVSSGFTRSLEFHGVGYKAAVKGKILNLNLGYSHAIDYPLPEGVQAKVAKNVIDLSSCDRELLGLVAAKVRSLRPPEPYKGKGIRYSDERILRKAGKSSGK